MHCNKISSVLIVVINCNFPFFVSEVYSFTSYSLLREPPRCHTGEQIKMEFNLPKFLYLRVGGGNILLSSMVILDNESITKTDTPSSFLQTTSIPTTNTTTSTPTTNIDVSLSPNRDEQSNESMLLLKLRSHYYCF